MLFHVSLLAGPNGELNSYNDRHEMLNSIKVDGIPEKIHPHCLARWIFFVPLQRYLIIKFLN